MLMREQHEFCWSIEREKVEVDRERRDVRFSNLGIFVLQQATGIYMVSITAGLYLPIVVISLFKTGL